jgi:hypothetical protein
MKENQPMVKEAIHENNKEVMRSTIKLSSSDDRTVINTISDYKKNVYQ